MPVTPNATTTRKCQQVTILLRHISCSLLLHDDAMLTRPPRPTTRCSSRRVPRPAVRAIPHETGSPTEHSCSVEISWAQTIRPVASSSTSSYVQSVTPWAPGVKDVRVKRNKQLEHQTSDLGRLHFFNYCTQAVLVITSKTHQRNVTLLAEIQRVSKVNVNVSITAK